MKKYRGAFRLGVAALAVIVAGTLRALPADGEQELPESPRFERLDADGDGKVSREEFLGSIRDKKRWWPWGRRTANADQNAATPELFTALDRDRDGYLTDQELNAGQRLQESRGDTGEGASRTRSAVPPGHEDSSRPGESKTPADKRAEESKEEKPES